MKYIFSNEFYTINTILSSHNSFFSIKPPNHLLFHKLSNPELLLAKQFLIYILDNFLQKVNTNNKKNDF